MRLFRDQHSPKAIIAPCPRVAIRTCMPPARANKATKLASVPP